VKKKIILGICLLCLLVAGHFANYGIRTTRPETLKALVEQHVKISSSPEAVMKFLDDQHYTPHILERRFIAQLPAPDFPSRSRRENRPFTRTTGLRGICVERPSL